MAEEREYWAERQARSQEIITEKKIGETEAQMRKYYLNSQKRVIEAFEDTYNHLLAAVAEGRTPSPSDLYKLDKYWQLQGQLKQELQKLGDKQAALLSKKFVEEYAEIYKALAAKDDLFFGEISKETATQMINQIWCADGKSWSSRIWRNTDLLQQALNDGLIDCVLTGKKASELKQALQDCFGASFTNADMIVRTEMAHIQTQAAKQRYEDSGIREVEIWASKDERRCKVCGELHKNRYPIGAAVPLPAHPRCRCCILPVID